MNAIITDIQRFSLNDEDGIRTTVFFKGCNMACRWCHNPETIDFKSELMFYKTKCIGCQKCFEVCPKGAHKIEDGEHIIDRRLCTGCGKCAAICSAEALVMCGQEMSVSQIMKEILQDKPYYDDSGGGVTLSGGEVLCREQFARELADACHKENIKVAIETNLSFPVDRISELLKKVDFIMCDIKIFDDEKHKKYTGISNGIILENIKATDSLNIPLIVRTPLIPGATDDDKNISDIAHFVKELKNLRRYELLNFNPLGEAKYKALDRENTYEKARPFDRSRLDQLEDMVKKIGVNVKIS